jgi:hypothetical protein
VARSVYEGGVVLGTDCWGYLELPSSRRTVAHAHLRDLSLNLMHPQFAGSKRKAKAAAREQRKVDALKKRLQKIYALSKLVENEDELDTMLAQIPDADVRAETKKLMETFVPFKYRKVTLATANDLVDLQLQPEKATIQLVQHG